DRGNVGDVILAVNHLSDKHRMEVAARKMGDRMALSVEETPLGTGGPLRLAAGMVPGNEPVVVVNGDIVSDIDLKGLTPGPYGERYRGHDCSLLGRRREAVRTGHFGLWRSDHRFRGEIAEGSRSGLDKRGSLRLEP